MEERDFSLARQELVKREGQAHGAILEMLRKFDEQPVPAVPAAGIRGERVTDETPPPVPRKREGFGRVGSAARRTRRMAKFVEDLPEEERQQGTETDEGEKANYRLSVMGPRVVAYEPAPWEEDAPIQQEPQRMERGNSQSTQGSQGLDSIPEDEDESIYSLPRNTKSLPSPPAEYNFPGNYFTKHKITPSDSSVPPTPRSPHPPPSSGSDFAILNSPTIPNSPPTIRSRAGLKKIFLSSLRPRRRDSLEPPSPSTPVSSPALSTPSLP